MTTPVKLLLSHRRRANDADGRVKVVGDAQFGGGMKHMHQQKIELSSNPVQRRLLNEILQGALALVALCLVATFAFAHIFTTFVQWDDEGYFLQAYRDFLSGHVLYDQVFSVYGPFTFYSAALLARFNPANVTHDYFRWVLLVGWVAIAALLAGVVWRWTGRSGPSIVALLLVGFRLSGLSKGVGHPQLWIILAVAVLLWLGLDWVYLPARQHRAFWTGLLIGIIFLCKINIGVFVSLAFALIVSLHLRGRPRKFACGSLLAAAAGLASLLLLSSSITSERYFAFAYLISVVVTVVIALGRPATRPLSLRTLQWLFAGLGISFCVGLGSTIADGTTIRGLVGNLVIAPALFARSYHNPFRDAARIGSILLSATGILLIIGALRWRNLADSRPSLLGVLKTAIGLGLLCAFAYDHRLALTGSLLFLWLLLIDTPPMADRAYSNRLLLALLSSLFSLQLFPLAGEQVDWAALLPMIAAAVLLADGINCLDRESFRAHLSHVVVIAARGTVMAVATCLFVFGGANTLRHFRAWYSAQPVNLSGTHWLRLPPTETARLKVTVSELSRNCQAVLTLPGLYSFSLWSGVPPVEEKRFNSGLFVWPDEVEKNELPKLRQQNRGCVLVSRDMYDLFRGNAVSPRDELLSDVQRTMRPIFAFQDLILYGSSQPNSAVSMDH